MNVSLDRQPDCSANLTIDIPAAKVEEVRNDVTNKYRKHARIPGYRPGKAPLAMLRSRYQREIDEETNEQVIGDALPEAISESGARILSIATVEPPAINPDGSVTIRATAELQPEFDLPDWKSLTVEVPRRPFTDEDVEKQITELAEPHATYQTITDRPLAMGDYAVVSTEVSLDGTPIAEALPDCPPRYGSRRNAWMLMDAETLLPGLCQAMEGMNANEERTFDLAIPDDFGEPTLAGKSLTCKTTLHAINTKTLPPVDDNLANLIEEGKTLAQLRESIKERGTQRSDQLFEYSKRNATAEKLVSMVSFELPPKALHRETHVVVDDIVHRMRQFGYPDDSIQQDAEAIHEKAEEQARQRLASKFILERIAEAEKIDVTDADMHEAILEQAYMSQTPVKKFVQELRRNNGLGQIRRRILESKALDLVTSGATVVETPAAD